MPSNPFNFCVFANLPAASAAAGQFYLVTDIGTSGTLFSSNGTIWRPANGTAVLAASGVAVSTGSDTTEDVLATITIPAGLMTANGKLEIETLWAINNNANNKTFFVRFGGTAGTPYLNVAATAAVAFQNHVNIQNAGSVSSQVGFPVGTANSYAAGGNPMTTSAVNTAAATTLIISGQKATATDTLTLSAYSVKLIIP